jgi:hypothetical protein
MTAVLVVCILLLVYLTFNQNYRYLEGFWKVDDEFAKMSGLATMFIYFKRINYNPLWPAYSGYVVSDVTNQTFTASARWSPTNTTPAQFVFSTDPIWPGAVRLDLDISNGKLVILDDSTIYGLFYKDHETSLQLNEPAT